MHLDRQIHNQGCYYYNIVHITLMLHSDKLVGRLIIEIRFVGSKPTVLSITLTTHIENWYQ